MAPSQKTSLGPIPKVTGITSAAQPRRLYTIFVTPLDEVSFEAPDMKQGKIVINAAYVKQRLQAIAEDEDLSKFIL